MSQCPTSSCHLPFFWTHWRGPLCFLSLTSIANVLEVAQSPSMAHPMDESRHTSASMATFFFWKHVHESSSILRLDMIQGKKSSKIQPLHLFHKHHRTPTKSLNMGLFDIPNNCFQAKLQGGSCIQQSLKLLWPRSLSERQSHIFDGCNFW